MEDLSRRDAIKVALGASLGVMAMALSPSRRLPYLFGEREALAASAPTVTVIVNYTDIVECTFFKVSSTDKNSSDYAFCADHATSPYIEGQTFSNGVRPSKGGFSVTQERMYDYLLYYGYGGKEPRYGYVTTQRVSWMIAHGKYYRDRDEGSEAYGLYDAALAYANAGGGGKPAGCCYFYANSGGRQPIVHAVFGKYGSVKVTKVRDGGHDDTFTFRIVVKSGSTTELDQTFTLKGGASRTFSDLPAGATYEVTETGGAEHYEAEWTNRTGTISEDGTAQVTCKNVSHGYLEVEKYLKI